VLLSESDQVLARDNNTLDHTITLQKAEAARQCRLVDGQRRLELSEVCLAATCDGRENTELRHPEPARPENIVVQTE